MSLSAAWATASDAGLQWGKRGIFGVHDELAFVSAGIDTINADNVCIQYSYIAHTLPVNSSECRRLPALTQRHIEAHASVV